MADGTVQFRADPEAGATAEMRLPRVGIVVLHWNKVDETKKCIQSLAHLRYERFHIYVVDNGSEVPLDNRVSEGAQDISIIRSSDNLGFAGGCNLGIRASVDAGCEFVWLLNNDAIVEPDALWHLVKVAEAEPGSGIIGSTILETDNRLVINHIGGLLKAYSGRTVHLGKGTMYMASSDLAAEGSRVSFVTGCSLLARVRMMQDVGLMDEGYFLYWEDVDWCVRCKRKGWDVLVAYESLVYHRSSSSVGSGSPLKSYYLARNSIRFTWRLYPWLIPLSMVWWPRRHLLNHLWRGRFEHARMAIEALIDTMNCRVIVPRVGNDGNLMLNKKVVQSESAS